MEIQICSYKEAGPFSGPIRGKRRKILINLKKSSSHEPLGQFQPNLTGGKHA